MHRTSLLALLCLMAASSCCSDVTARFCTFKWDTSPPFALVDLQAQAVRAVKPVSSPRPAVVQLSDQGQASYVNALAAASSDAKQLLSHLAKSFPRSTGTSTATQDLTRIAKRLVISARITNRPQLGIQDPITPADRISSLEIHLKPNEGWLRFESWDKFGTVYGTVDLGKITSARTSSFNAKLAPTLSGTIKGVAAVGGSVSQTTTEELVLKERIMALSGILAPHECVILQEGGLGLDLEGNTSVDLVLTMDGSPKMMVGFGTLFDKGVPKRPLEVLPAFSTVRMPYHARGREASLTVDAVYGYRHVRGGRNTVIEGDDHVTLYRGSTSHARATLLTTGEYFNRCRYHWIGNGTHWLHVESSDDKKLLQFRDDQDAKAFFLWLKALATSMQPKDTFVLGQGAKQWAVSLGTNALTADKIGSLDIHDQLNAE